MAIQSFVTYSITVSPKKSYMMDSDGIQIAQESVDPSDARLHPMVVTLLQDIARDFVFSMGSKFTKTAQATIRFSDREGIIFESSTNDRIQGARESKLKGMVTAISLSDAVRAGITDLKQEEPTNEAKLKASMQFGEEPHIFVDLNAMTLWNSGFTGEKTVNLKIIPSATKV